MIALLLSVACDKGDEEKVDSNKLVKSLKYNPPDWILGSWSFDYLGKRLMTLEFSKTKLCAIDVNSNKTCRSASELNVAGFEQESSNTVYKMTEISVDGNKVLLFKKISKTSFHWTGLGKLGEDLKSIGIDKLIFKKI